MFSKVHNHFIDHQNHVLGLSVGEGLSLIFIKKVAYCLIFIQVCYYGQHYHCFAYSCDHGQWIMYDDNTVKVIGGWDDVLAMCEKGHLQPHVLFFEAMK